jgi:hypothetical protein
MSYLLKLADTQSGSRVIPRTIDFEFDYPNKGLRRCNLFHDFHFLTGGSSVVEISALISSCGGTLVDLKTLPKRDLIIVDSYLDPDMLEGPISDCLTIDSRLLLKTIHCGSLEFLTSLPKVVIGSDRSKRVHEASTISKEEWICSVPSGKSVSSDFSSSERVGVKRFKKRHAQNSSDSVKLEVWDGKEVTRRRREATSIPLTERNEIDEWFDSYSTQ